MRKLYLGVSLTVGKQMIRLTHRKRNMMVEAEASAQIQVFRFWKSLTSLTSVRLTTTRSTNSSWAREARYTCNTVSQYISSTGHCTTGNQADIDCPKVH